MDSWMDGWIGMYVLFEYDYNSAVLYRSPLIQAKYPYCCHKERVF